MCLKSVCCYNCRPPGGHVQCAEGPDLSEGQSGGAVREAAEERQEEHLRDRRLQAGAGVSLDTERVHVPDCGVLRHLQTGT